jgi:hypothetical protein
VYPVASHISTEVIKASADMQSIPLKINRILKVIVQFSGSGEEFKLLAGSLSDLRHFFNGLISFLQQYSQFISDPPTANPLKVLHLLIYNAQIMESATAQIKSSSENFSKVFGGNIKVVMEKIIETFTTHIKNVRTALETLNTSFESILKLESDITLESVESELQETSISETIAAFKEISIASKQLSFVFSGLIELTQTLEGATSKVSDTLDTVKSKLSLITFTLNVEIQSAKSIFRSVIGSNVQGIIEAFGNYSQTSLQVFANTTSKEFHTFLQDTQRTIDEYSSKSSEMLTKTQIDMLKKLQEYYTEMYKTAQSVQEKSLSEAQTVTNFIAQLVIKNSGSSFNKCFASNTGVQKLVAGLLPSIENEFKMCMVAERMITLKVQELMSFIVEDVTLNIQGMVNQLCKCSVPGGKKNQDKSMECIKKVVQNF